MFFQNDLTFVTVHHKRIEGFPFLVGDAIDCSETDQTPFNEDNNETIVKEMEQHAPGQDSVSDGEDNTFNTPIDFAEDVKQTCPHYQEDTSDDDVLSKPDYNPTCKESSAPESEDSLAVATAPEQHGSHLEDEDVDVNNTVKGKDMGTSVQEQKKNKSKDKCLKEISVKAIGPPCN